MNFGSNINEQTGIDDATWGMYEPNAWGKCLKWVNIVSTESNPEM